jgi:hypothetical protein
MTDRLETLQEATERYRVEIDSDLPEKLIKQILEIQLENSEDPTACKKRADQAILYYLESLKK